MGSMLETVVSVINASPLPLLGCVTRRLAVALGCRIQEFDGAIEEHLGSMAMQ